jgi:RimJ/RimL family protein N-acetyltransferase
LQRPRERPDTRAVSLRPASPADSERMFEWANDPATRAASFRPARITRAEHRRWCAESLAGARLLFIVEVTATPTGLVRLDRIDSATAEVGILVAKEQRGRGLSVPALRALIDVARDAGFRNLLARIRLDNLQSRHIFERAGFELAGEDTVHGVQAACYRLQLFAPP